MSARPQHVRTRTFASSVRMPPPTGSKKPRESERTSQIHISDQSKQGCTAGGAKRERSPRRSPRGWSCAPRCSRSSKKSGRPSGAQTAQHGLCGVESYHLFTVDSSGRRKTDLVGICVAQGEIGHGSQCKEPNLRITEFDENTQE